MSSFIWTGEVDTTTNYIYNLYIHVPRNQCEEAEVAKMADDEASCVEKPKPRSTSYHEITRKTNPIRNSHSNARKVPIIPIQLKCLSIVSIRAFQFRQTVRCVFIPPSLNAIQLYGIGI